MSMEFLCITLLAILIGSANGLASKPSANESGMIGDIRTVISAGA